MESILAWAVILSTKIPGNYFSKEKISIWLKEQFSSDDFYSEFPEKPGR